MELGGAIPILILVLIGVCPFDKGVEIYGFMSFPAGHASNLFLIEVLGADISGTGEAKFKILLKEEIISGCAFIFDVVFQISSGLHSSKAESLHDCDYFIIDGDFLKAYIDAKRINLCEADKPGVFSNLGQTQSIFWFDVDEPTEEIFKLR